MSDSAPGKVLYVNRALLLLGQPASYSIDSETSLGGIVDTLWPLVEARCVAIYDWSFCKRTSQPEALAGAPDNGWTYGFALPGDRIGDPLAVLDRAGTSEHYLREFMIESGNLYTNVTPVWVRCRVMLDPAVWDQGFAAAFVMALAGQLAVPLLQDEDLGAALTADAFGRPQEMGGGGLFGKLIALNRAAQPQGRGFMSDDPLTAARFS